MTIFNKRLLVFSILLVFASSACTKTASKAVSPEPTRRINLTNELYLRQIGEGAYVITDTFPWSANSLLVRMSDGNTGFSGHAVYSRGDSFGFGMGEKTIRRGQDDCN